MSDRAVFHVVPDANSWKVRREGEGDYEVLVDNKDNAIQHARELAQENATSQVIIHTQDGRIETEFTYGDDPRNVPG